MSEENSTDKQPGITLPAWVGSEETCPKCGIETEELHYKDTKEDDYQPEIYVRAERCRVCGWVVDFDADEIKGQRLSTWHDPIKELNT